MGYRICSYGGEQAETEANRVMETSINAGKGFIRTKVGNRNIILDRIRRIRAGKRARVNPTQFVLIVEKSVIG